MSANQEKITTKERLILAAEKLFAEKGFSEVSLRDITTEAEANVASVSYYFSSKDALTEEVIYRHVSPVNSARIKYMQQLREEYGENPLPIRKILYAFVEPMMDGMQSSSLRSDLFGKIMGRCMANNTVHFPIALEEQIREVMKLFIAEITRSLPHLAPEVVVQRLHFCFGAVAHTLLFAERVSNITGQEVKYSTKESLEHIVDFCYGGLTSDESGKI